MSSSLRSKYNEAKSKAKDKEGAVVLCATSFGIFRVNRVWVGQSDILQVCVRHSDGTRPLLLIPVEQCSFMVSIVPMTDPGEEMVVGFGEPPKS